jgi:hypothetical protein
MNESDLALLRRFEPVLRFTRGEQFFPMAVEPYVRESSLWLYRPGREPICLEPVGELTLEKLAEPRAGGFDAVYFLQFIEPLDITELAAYRLREGLARKDPRQVFHAGRGRLARVGYVARLIDALFSLTLLARGRVPGDTAAAAALAYQRITLENEHYCYYGRVLHENGWTVLQYWFFYPFNDWRTGFSGANDHEADWEMVCVYLYEAEPGDFQPEWVAYAAHDYTGDDLRRRWDDAEVEKVGEHPVIYVGSGSHASYYAAGEYLAELELSFLAPFSNMIERVRRFWRNALGHMHDEDVESDHQPHSMKIFRVPFVDYARGDGLTLGPGQDKEWDPPGLLNPAPPWALHYRGLWGLYTRDPVAGEDAPAGPLYNRDGTMRRSWYDPAGWAGLDKVPPPNCALRYAREQYAAGQQRQKQLEETIAGKSRRLSGLGLEVAAMRDQPHLKEQYLEHQEEIATLAAELDDLRGEVASDEALLEALALNLQRLEAGYRGPVRAHLHRVHHPFSDAGLRFSRVAEMWAAISIGLMMLVFVGLVIFAREYLIFGLVALISLLIFIEAGFRKRLMQLVSSVTIALAVVASLILLFDFFWSIVVIGVLVAGGYIMWENLRELWQ